MFNLKYAMTNLNFNTLNEQNPEKKNFIAFLKDVLMSLSIMTQKTIS